MAKQTYKTLLHIEGDIQIRFRCVYKSSQMMIPPVWLVWLGKKQGS